MSFFSRLTGRSDNPRDKPNILFIVADDLNSWIEPLGAHPQVKTPAINQLAQAGTVFTRAYCAAPYCNASRMAVFTGCLPTRTGVYHNEPFWQQETRRTTYLEHLRNEGYFCFGAGKVFHGAFGYGKAIREKADRAPWVEMQNRPEHWDQYRQFESEPMPPDRPLHGMFSFDDFDTISPWNYHLDWGVLPKKREAETPDHHTTQATIDFLSKPHEKPFFCAAGFYKPHLPWFAPQRFFDLYPLEDVILPIVKEDDLDDVPEIPRSWVGKPPDHETILAHGQWRHAVQGYLAAISYCDYQIGLVLDALKNSPHADNTIIVLWGDNGFHLGEKLHWRKFVLWEEACRVPFIVVDPREKTNTPRVDSPVSLTDLFPTLCAMSETAQIDDVDGQSLLPLIQGDQQARSRPAAMIWRKGNISLRRDQWRYTQYHDGSEELYDHNSDPHEWTNLAGDARFEAVSQRFRSEIDRVKEQG